MIPHQAELPLIRDWLSTCEQGHKDCQHVWQETSVDELHLRVIDVHDRRIVVAPKNCNYVALSYMWGNRDLVVETLKSNLETFMLPQGLDKGPKPLPRTISDAVDLVRAIGQRYLWVDALCIIQDDEDDKAHQIRNMDLVYGLASFTIMAADGEGAEVRGGLAGVKSGTRNIVQDIQEVEPNLTLAVSLGPQQRSRSKWNSRAWTFQEALLSRRMVIFFNGEMTWECREAVWTEDLHVSPGAAIGSFAAPHYSNSMTPLLEGRLAAIRADSSANVSTYTSMSSDNLTVYENAVREYTARVMTYQSDMLNAFAGLAKTLEPALASSFLQGLPQNCLDTALLWTPEQILDRRSGFASWSWAGWVGKSRYISMNQNVIKPMVRYYVVDKNAGANPILLPQKWEGNYEPSLRTWRVVKPASLPTTSATGTPQFSWPNSNTYELLGVFALAAAFEHFNLKMGDSSLLHSLELVDHPGHKIGQMGLDTGALHPNETYLLIMLSECSEHVQKEGIWLKLPSQIIPSARRSARDECELRFFNVMLVRCSTDCAVAERLGLGWMQKAEFLKANPKWSSVVLQ